MRIEFHEELLLHQEFLPPIVVVDRLDLFELFRRELWQAGEIERLGIRHPTECPFLRIDSPGAAIYNPLEDPHIFPKTRPEEFALPIFAEPIDVKDPGWVFDATVHVDPV